MLSQSPSAQASPSFAQVKHFPASRQNVFETTPTLDTSTKSLFYIFSVDSEAKLHKSEEFNNQGINPAELSAILFLLPKKIRKDQTGSA